MNKNINDKAPEMKTNFYDGDTLGHAQVTTSIAQACDMLTYWINCTAGLI